MRTDPGKSSSDPLVEQGADATSLVHLPNNSYIPFPLSSAENTDGVALYPPLGQRGQYGRESMLELLGQTSNAYMVQHYEENAMLMPGVGSSGMFGSLQGMVQSFSTERTSDMFMYSV
ncbi:unnamed protein product [Urochloa humidicola]